MYERLIQFVSYILNESNKDFQENLEHHEIKILREIKELQRKIDEDYFELDIENIESVFSLSWNVQIDEIDSEIVYYLFGLLLLDMINFEIFRSVFHEIAGENSSADELTVIAFLSISVLEHHDIDVLEVSYSDFLMFNRNMGIKTPLLYSNFVEIVAKINFKPPIFIKKEEKYPLLETAVINLSERSQYMEEISSQISPEVIPDLDNFIDYKQLSDLSYLIAENVSKKIQLQQKTALTKAHEIIEREFNEMGYPIIPIVYDPMLKSQKDKLEARTIRMEELAALPNDLINEFATLKAYSCHSLAQKIRIQFLGGGGIGNMGILVQHNNNAILLDFGMSVANYSIPKWHPSLRFVKAVLVTHAHLDHTGALPYLIRPDDGKRWYGSPSTRKLTEKLLFNTSAIIKGNYSEGSDLSPFFSNYLKQSSLVNLFNVFNPLKVKETVEISPGFEVTPYNSAHIFGSFGYEINIYGKRIFFSGDFKQDSTELFKGATFPMDCDITIFDGTYYNRPMINENPNTVIQEAAAKSNRLIIPAFSVGRSQEVFKRLERLRLTKNRNVKIIGLASDVTREMGITGDYSSARSINPEDFKEGDIIIAGHGMLQGGAARQLLNSTKDDNSTGVLLCGYQAPNTLGFALKNSHPIALNMYNQEIFFAPISGHTSSNVLDEYIENLNGQKLMVHTPKGTEVKSEHEGLKVPHYNQLIKESVT